MMFEGVNSMSESEQERSVSDDLEIKKIIGQIAAAYLGNNHVMPSDLSGVIEQIAKSLAGAGVSAPETPAEAPEASEVTKLTPAQIRRSVTSEAIISFEDNKPYKTMRRHLASRGMTPQEYREKWGLPRDYPMVAPAYSEARSNLAKERGLGVRLQANAAARRAEAAAAPPELAPPPASDAETPPQTRPQPRGAGRRPARAAAAVSAPAVQLAKTSTDQGATKRGRKTPGRPRRAKTPSDSGAAS
jgi:predicted transcriptional regulator